MVMIEVNYRPIVCLALAYHLRYSLQVFTGAVPFGNSLSPVCTLAIMGGDRPSRPVHPALTNNLWTSMQRCWNQDLHLRPEVSEVLEVLNNR